MFTKDDSMRCHMIQKIVATCDAMRCDAMCWFSWDDMIFCNHLAKFVHPQRRFWKTEQKMNCGFSIDFSMVPSPVKRTSKMMFSSFVHSSKIQWKGPRKWCFHLCSPVQNLRLGSTNFARWLQRIVASCDVMRCVGFLGMLWSFVTSLYDDTTVLQERVDEKTLTTAFECGFVLFFPERLDPSWVSR